MPYDSLINNDDNNRDHQQQQPPRQQQHVQNERKISDHLALNHPNYHSVVNERHNLRHRRDTKHLYDDENQLLENYDDYDFQNDGKILVKIVS